jgi:MFS transporter, ACDE family, multidrug resistance protein
VSADLLRQPKAVWAVAFACVVAFMGIGLVDPILPVLAQDLDATPSQVSMLFTSYFAITGVAMLVTGFVASRLGAKRTLLGGLALVIVFSALAGASDTVAQIAGFRAGWGLGNALFIATALAVIVGAASGGVVGAIMLYEAALGLGIASGPLVGGFLGGISWRGPFFGVAVLMAVAFAAIAVLLDRTPAPAEKVSLAAPIKALRHRGLLAAGIVALFYNFGFFTLLAYTPFPLHLGAHELGYVFFGWGLLVAIFSVAVAPAVKRRLGTVGTLATVFVLFGADLLVMALAIESQTTLILCVILAGAFIGVVNTVLTEAVMKVAPVERPIASSAYSFLRFAGGAIAPWLAGRLAEEIAPETPYFVGAGAVVIALVLLLVLREAIGAADVDAPPVRPAAILVAVDATPASAAVTRAAAGLARERGANVEVVHVLETDVVGEDAADLETAAGARAVLDAHVGHLTRHGIAARGALLHAVGDHEDTARAVLDRAAAIGAGVVVLGEAHHGRHSLTRSRSGHEGVELIVVEPEELAA